tara:strand:- start:75366 stop:75545 length:180 start_codon:yes stop_codon:yes gene_type:complete
MQQDKEDRRSNYKQKSSKQNHKDIAVESRDKNKITKKFKHRKAEIEQDELWEDWQEQYR